VIPLDRTFFVWKGFVWGGLAILALSLLSMQWNHWWATSLLANFHLHLAVVGAALMAFGLVWRRWFQAGIGAAIILANVGLVASQLPPAAAAVPGQTALRVMTINVLYDNRNVTALREHIVEESPDVVLMQEVNRRWARDLTALYSLYPHRLLLIESRPLLDDHGTVLFSRYPISDAMRPTLGGIEGRLTAARVSVDGRPLWLASTHMVKPSTPGGQALQRAQLNDLAGWAASVSGPLVIGGDFNATVYMPQLHELLETQSLSTDLQSGQWWKVAVGTYPSWLPLLGLKIDHILARDAAIATSDIVTIEGSDHRAVVADIVLPEQR
jgi:endonuclease/exonuclease/phosphatase (EEP) superfamily protein YafD